MPRLGFHSTLASAQKSQDLRIPASSERRGFPAGVSLLRRDLNKNGASCLGQEAILTKLPGSSARVSSSSDVSPHRLLVPHPCTLLFGTSKPLNKPMLARVATFPESAQCMGHHAPSQR